MKRIAHVSPCRLSRSSPQAMRPNNPRIVRIAQKRPAVISHQLRDDFFAAVWPARIGARLSGLISKPLSPMQFIAPASDDTLGLFRQALP
jgi:hypothetical protein